MKNKYFFKGFFIVYILFIVVSVFSFKPIPVGEWDDYSLATASFINQGNFSVVDSDVEKAKELFPEWALDLERYSLSGRFARNGGEMNWYFPTYSLVCVPATLIFHLVGIPAVYGFAATNLFFFFLSLVCVYFKLKDVEKEKRQWLVMVLAVNPVIFYFTWISSEVFIYSLLVMSLVYWYNKKIHASAMLLSIASTLNPTILIVGFIMIVDFFVGILREWKRKENVFLYLLKKWKQILLYGCCYLIGLVPFAYNYYNTGYINLTASYESFTTGTESILERAIAYLLDLNYGFLPYYSIVFILSIVLFIISIYKKHYKYIMLYVMFLCNVMAYSIMIHINHGMSGMARYSVWAAVIMLFPVVLYYDELIKSVKLRKTVITLIGVSTCLSGLIVWNYGVNQAEKTHYFYMTPVAEAVLDHAPFLYNPLKSTFKARTNHMDGYTYALPVVYENKDGYVRKVLANRESREELLKKYKGEGEDQLFWEQKLDSLDEKPTYISVCAGHSIFRCVDLEIGNPICFGSEGYNADLYILDGASKCEGDFSWTVGECLSIRADLYGIEEGESIKGKITIKGLIYDQPQNVQIEINGKNIVNAVVREAGELEFTFPWDGEILNMNILLPDALAPSEVSNSLDRRKLALQIQSISFMKE